MDSTEQPQTEKSTTSSSIKSPEKPQAGSTPKLNQSPAKDAKVSEEKTESESSQNGDTVGIQLFAHCLLGREGSFLFYFQLFIFLYLNEFKNNG